MINTIRTITILDAIEKCVSSAEKFYLYGGCVRDLLLSRSLNDVDVLVSEPLEDVVKEFTELTGFYCFSPGRKFPFYRCVSPDRKFSVDFQRGELYRFLKSRDFTVNALAVRGDAFSTFISGRDPQHVIDLSGGLKDLKKGILKMVSSKCFDEDPVRLLRLVRYILEIDFLPETATLSQARKKADLILIEAKERISNEIDFFIKKNLEKALRWLEKANLFERLFPEADLNLFLRAIRRFDRELLSAEKISPLMDKDRTLIYYLRAMLFNRSRKGDYGYWPWWQVSPKKILSRAAILIDRALECQLAKSKQEIIEIVFNSRYPRLQAVTTIAFCDLEEELKRELIETSTFSTYAMKIKPLLSGSTLREIGVREGPLIGKKLKALKILQAKGEIRTEEEAMAWLGKDEE